MNKLIEEFKKKNKNYKYVFFDIFDTIVFRKVEPEYIKKIWAQHVVKILKLDIKSQNLYNLRNKVESRLCKLEFSKTGESEFKYQDMIKEIYFEIKINIDLKSFAKLCEEIEIEIETNAQIICEDTIELINYLITKKIKIYCLSDMYLSKKMIEEIFKNIDILKYFENIFVSSEILLSKKSGKIYDYISKFLKINKENILMLGDNRHSDYNMAIENGIDAIYIDRSEQKEKYKQFLNNILEEKTIKNIKDLIKKKKENSFVDIVFSLYNFTEKLYFSLIEKNAKDIVFFSREGQFLKKLFDDYQNTIYGRKIKTHYAIVSRKSTYIASLKEIEKEEFSLFDQYANISVEAFIKSLNFDEEEIKEVESSLEKQLNFTDNIQKFQNSSEFGILKNNLNFKRIYDKKRIEQKENIIKYFKELKLSDNNKLYVVDIGWKGSIQTNLVNIIDYDIYGYYFGLINKENNLNDREGIIFSNIPNNSKNFNLYNENRSLYEILLGANHGSAQKYIVKNNKIEVLTYETSEEKKIFEKTISPIQKEIYLYFKNIKEVLQNRIYDITIIEKLFNKVHYKMLFLPNKNYIEFFNKIYHYENFGLFGYTRFTGKQNYKNKLKELGKYIFRNKIYVSDYYWPQLKNYHNNVKLIAKLYALQRFIEFKIKKII